MIQPEFYGAFTSWMDVKRDFGARGDGITDDTNAWRKALEAIRYENAKGAVLFVPAGVYRITDTLSIAREAHTESMHISIIGEHPSTTILRWDGARGEMMVIYSGWYSRMSRLTLDGAGKAGTGVLCAPRFSTYNEFSDMVFTDVAFGIEAGRMDTDGVAETTVTRCRFVRCTRAGISIQNWNSLDWFIWHCRFQQCRFGVTNTFGAGNYHVYESLFEGSTEADLGIGNAAYFAARGNLSIGSARFLKTFGLDACAFTTLQNNAVLEPQELAVEVLNLGPLFLLDNTFQTQKAPVVRVRDDAGLVSAGNQFTVKSPVQAGASALILGDKVVSPRAIITPSLRYLETPEATRPPVIVVPAGSGDAKIQQAITQATKLRGKRPVIHLPAGRYNIKRTLDIPAGCDLRLVGDGGGAERGTALFWVGAQGHPMIRIAGPCNIGISNLALYGADIAHGIVVQNCDQPNSFMSADQLNIVSAQGTGLLAERLQYTRVLLYNINHADCALAIKAHGAQVTIFSGASSNNRLSYYVDEGGTLLVRDIWYETGNQPRFMVLAGRGTFAMQSARVALPPTPAELPVVEVGEFLGRVVFAATDFNCGNKDKRKVTVSGSGKGLSLLVLGCGGDGEDDLLSAKVQAQEIALLLPHRILPGGGWVRVHDDEKTDRKWLLKMLEVLRQPHPRPQSTPARSTGVRLHRVIISHPYNGVHIHR